MEKRKSKIRNPIKEILQAAEEEGRLTIATHEEVMKMIADDENKSMKEFSRRDNNLHPPYIG